MREGEVLQFRVRVRRPANVTEEMLREYIHEAISGWKGQFDFENPLSDLDHDGIRVMRGKKIHD